MNQVTTKFSGGNSKLVPALGMLFNWTRNFNEHYVPTFLHFSCSELTCLEFELHVRIALKSSNDVMSGLGIRISMCSTAFLFLQNCDVSGLNFVMGTSWCVGCWQVKAGRMRAQVGWFCTGRTTKGLLICISHLPFHHLKLPFQWHLRGFVVWIVIKGYEVRSCGTFSYHSRSFDISAWRCLRYHQVM